MTGNPTDPIKTYVNPKDKTYGYTRTDQKLVDPRKQAFQYGVVYDTDPKSKVAIRAMYPDLPWFTDEKSAKATAIQRLVQSRPIQSHEKQGSEVYEKNAMTQNEKEQKQLGWANYQLRKKEFDDKHAKEGGKTYVQDLGDRLKDPDKFDEAGDEINAWFANNPAYLHGVNVSKLGDGRIQVDIPHHYKTTKDATTGGYSKAADEGVMHKILDPSKPEEYIQTLQSIHDMGDPKHSSDKALTPQGKGLVHGEKDAAKVKHTTLDKIKSLVGKPGYEGYTEQELIDYYKKQGFTIK
jgi:hypothetical protein